MAAKSRSKQKTTVRPAMTHAERTERIKAWAEVAKAAAAIIAALNLPAALAVVAAMLGKGG